MLTGLLMPPSSVQPPAIPGIDDSALAVSPEIKAQFSSPLKLLPDQENKFVHECLMRINELRTEVGLSVTNEVIPGSWMWLRQCHELYYMGDLSWRKAFGGIFLKSNITLGSGLRHVRYNWAKMSDDLLGTSPFMAALAKKQDKEDFARQVEEYVQNELERSNAREQLREAQKIALYRNECVVKTGYLNDTSPYVGEATVLVDAQTGEPIKTTEKQLYVYEDDQMIPDPTQPGVVMLEGDPSMKFADNPNPGEVTILPDPTDPAGVPRIGVYQRFEELPQILVQKDGLYAETLDHRSFLCPLRVKSVHDADTVVHLYLETPNRLQKIYGGIDVSQQYFAFWNQPGQDKPKYEQGEYGQPTTAIYQQIIVAEVYRRCDPDKTGEDKEILLVLDMTNGRPIYYNYLANHMPKRPFDVLPGVERIPGRWYGRGIYGMLDSHLFYEDVEASRSFWKNSQDATIQFGYRDALEDWRNGVEPQIGDGMTNWIRPDWNIDGRIKSPLWRENLASNYEPDEKLMNIMRQSADSLVGSISTASANESDFNQSKTATGNQLVQQAADAVTRAAEQDQTVAIGEILKQLVECIMEHMDETVLAADPNTGEVAKINRNAARNLDRDVRLLLTRSKSTQLVSTSAQAIDIGLKYRHLVLTDPQGAKDLRDLFVSQLKGLEVPDADMRCPEVTDEMIAQWQQSQAAGMQNQKPPNESISVKLGDLVGNERTQALAKFGIQADPVALQQEEAQEQADKQAQQTQHNAAPNLHVIPGIK